ncbi:hypothetical protein MKW92_003023 [Papaver armeniacum]|nr:hypothetical protein MKW92_003023 [Papaver armeniacum]
MKRVSFENEFNGKFIPEDQIDLFYEKMKDTVVKICAILDHIEANDENEDVEMNDQEDVSSTRQARKQAAQNIEVVKSSVGTGVIIKKGYVLTAEHVVAGAKVVFIRKVEKNDYYQSKFLTRRVEFTPRNDTMVGSQALHIGHPNDYEYSFFRGAVAHPRRCCEGNMAAEFQLNNLHGVLFKLAKLFGKCGKILRIFFPLDKTTKKRKGYALIEFKDEAGVNKALLKDETRFFQKIYKVETVRCKHGQ